MATSHQCYNGKIFNDTRTAMIPCPICEKERKLEARDGVKNEETGEREPLAKKLGLNRKFVTDVYSEEHIIGKADAYYLERDSLREFNTATEKLISNLQSGVVPSTSIIMYLGRHAKLQEFAYILLASAYKGLLTVGSMLTARDIRMNKYRDDFNEHFDNDLEVVIATNDLDIHGLSEIQGFMQERAYKNKPTIVLLSNRRNFTTILGTLCSLDEPRYDLGSYLGVNYKKVDMSKESITIARKAIEVSNNSLETEQKLEDRYKQLPTKDSNHSSMQPNNTPSFDIDEYTSGNVSFDGS